jgi:hypothetical protein
MSFEFVVCLRICVFLFCFCLVLRVFLILVFAGKKGMEFYFRNMCEYVVIYWLHTQYEQEQLLKV